jgi:hypothetical protein
MMRYRYILLLFCVAILFSVSCVGVHEKNDGENNFAKNDFGSSRSIVNNVGLSVSIPSAVKASQPVLMTVELTNNNNFGVMWGEIDGVSEFHIQLFNSQNHLPAQTTTGKIYGFGLPQSAYSGYTEFHYIPLKPGASKEWQLDLRDYFALPPDSYRISISMDLLSAVVDAKMSISVNNIAFKIE